MAKVKYPDYFTENDYMIEPEEVREEKIEALLKAMTFDEKCSLLGGGIEPEKKGKIGNGGYQPGVPRLGVPEVVMYDGPAGITGIVETTGLPQPVLLGSAWDEELAYDFGKAAATETAACSGNFILGPQLDVIRSPHFGRNKDILSEDSFLAAKLGAAETRGTQDNHAVAVVKHFAAANTFGIALENGAPAIGGVNSVIDEQTLHESYLRTFETAVRDGHTGSIMSSYNRVNGEFSSANRYLNVNVARDMWNFKGSIMSDWGGVHSFVLNCGTDIEMPYPAYTAKNRILKNIRRGKMTFEDVDNACRHVLWAMSTIGLLSLVQLDEKKNACEDPEHTEPIEMTWYYDEEVKKGMLDRHAKIAEKIAKEGIILAKNENEALPLPGEKKKGKLALIGLGAKYPICGEAQERSFGRLERMTAPGQIFREATDFEVTTEPGMDLAGEIIGEEFFYIDSDCTRHGLSRYFGILPEDRAKKNHTDEPGGAGGAFVGHEVLDEDGDTIDTGISNMASLKEFYPDDYPLGQLDGIEGMLNRTCGYDEKGQPLKHYVNGVSGNALGRNEAFTWKSYLKAPEDGEYTLLLEAIGGEATFLIQLDGKWEVVGDAQLRECTQWPWETIICTPEGMGITGRKLELRKDQIYPIIVMARQAVRNKDLQIRLAWETPAFQKDTYTKALEAAARADTIIFYASDIFRGKGVFDYLMVNERNIQLPEEQMRLFRDVVKSRKEGAKIITVLQTSNARAVKELDEQSDALLITYMPGQEGSRAICDIILGNVNPAGKLTQSWPADSEETALADTEEHFEIRQRGTWRNDAQEIRFEEGIFTGYRWYDKYGEKPLYAFGHGLSYTAYEYSGLEIFQDEKGYKVRFTVTNTGERTGDEIAQVYLGKAEVPAHIQMAEKQLVGFKRVRNIAPKKSARVEIPIEERMLCYWDPALRLEEQEDGTMGKWRKARGIRGIYVGASAVDIRLTGCVRVE